MTKLRMHLLGALAGVALTACTTMVDDAATPDGATQGSATPTGPACTTDADCTGGATCVNVSTDPEFSNKVCTGGGGGGGGCDPATDPSCAVDTSCAMAGGTTYYPPFVPLVPPQVPATCNNGFEINNSSPLVYTIDAKTAAGSRAITLDVDIATYVAPNHITIRGVDANGQSYVLLDTCRMQTWDAADPTSPRGEARPLDITIRQFRIDVKQGTKQLSFDFSNDSTTPFYVKAVGLCDFDVSANPWAGTPTKLSYWRPI